MNCNLDLFFSLFGFFGLFFRLCGFGHNSGLDQQIFDGIARLSTLADPKFDAFAIDSKLLGGIFGDRIVKSELFDDPTVAWGAAVDRVDSITGPITSAKPL